MTLLAKIFSGEQKKARKGANSKPATAPSIDEVAESRNADGKILTEFMLNSSPNPTMPSETSFSNMVVEGIKYNDVVVEGEVYKALYLEWWFARAMDEYYRGHNSKDMKAPLYLGVPFARKLEGKRVWGRESGTDSEGIKAVYARVLEKDAALNNMNNWGCVEEYLRLERGNLRIKFKKEEHRLLIYGDRNFYVRKDGEKIVRYFSHADILFKRNNNGKQENMAPDVRRLDDSGIVEVRFKTDDKDPLNMDHELRFQRRIFDLLKGAGYEFNREKNLEYGIPPSELQR
ncbi:MAG TPA: hypothetical protein VJI75_04700 [Candidatus Nanoarchaeia archaeon]|nr:hypothetical protein [Candidatus Nanoarchaeia archaeon]